MPDPSVPVLFGAFDRHNFGDLLFPHVVGALLPQRPLRMCGLSARDLTAFGGRPVERLAAPVAHLIHAGGELLTCTAWQAAVMLLAADAARDIVRRLDADPEGAAAWAERQLAVARTMPYVAGRDVIAPGGQLIFNAVGGVEWDQLDASQRAEVAVALREADWISVRDCVTQAALRADGIDASLCPDPGVMVAQCCGDVVRAHAERGAVKALRDACPRGYIACQCSADFADDASLDALAHGLVDAMATGLDVVLFRAGAAPWHDDLALYAQLQRRLPTGRAHVFRGLHLWDICALIAASRGTITSSLHGRIVALAYGLPRVSLALPQQGARPDKVTAFVQTWEPATLVPPVAAAHAGVAFVQARAMPAGVLRDVASQLCSRYRASQTVWAGLLPAPNLAQ